MSTSILSEAAAGPSTDLAATSTVATPSAGGTAAITPATLRRFDVAGPRYTSYPTADRFVDAFGADAYAQALRQRALGARALP